MAKVKIRPKRQSRRVARTSAEVLAAQTAEPIILAPNEIMIRCFKCKKAKVAAHQRAKRAICGSCRAAAPPPGLARL